MSNGNSSKLNSCGCCATGNSLATPFNRPGLPALSYRIGYYATFLRDMLSRIHSVAIADGPNQGVRSLAALTTRAADDPSIALLDAWAVVADVLTFYQERIANEGYLRTATERLSVLELARMIGYELSPGVAASTFLAFTVDDGPGSSRVVTVPSGTRIQSVPPQGKLPQTFETTESIQAAATRNALRPRLTRPQDLALILVPDTRPQDPAKPKRDPNKKTLQLYMLGISTSFPPSSFQTFLASQVYPLNGEQITGPVEAIPVNNQVYFAGTSTSLQKGDRLLLVGRNDHTTPAVQTKVLIVRDIETQSSLNRTRVDARDDLGQTPEPPGFEPRQRDPVPLPTQKAPFNVTNVGKSLQGKISESALSATVKMNGWDSHVVELQAAVSQLPPLAKAPPPNESAELPQADPGILALRTHIGFFGNNAPSYKTLLAPVDRGFDGKGQTGGYLYPFDWDVKGAEWDIWKDSLSVPTEIEFYNQFHSADVFLDQVVPGILRDSWIVLELPVGDPTVFRVGTVSEAALAGFGLSGRATGLRLTKVDGILVPGGKASEIDETEKPTEFKVRTTTAYAQSEALDLAGLPIEDDIPAGTTELMLDNLVLGLQAGQPIAVSGTRTAAEAPGIVSNEVLILQDIAHVAGFTSLEFSGGLAYSYVRNTVTLNANVARATHGETITEVMGSGDASQANQSFTLRRPPLTYVPAPTATGAQSTLELRVNDLLWQEVPSLSGPGARDQDYIVRLDNNGATTITFGDGISGARLPSGQQNIAARYRTGIGLDGNVDAGSLGLFQTRPPGIRTVTNPLAASGSAAREDLDHARLNAPLKVLTLDRIVSLEDYENFARAFAGIGKAQAVGLWSGDRYLVHLTVAGAEGDVVDPASALYSSLLGAIGQARDPVQQVLVASYQPLFFNLEAGVLVDQPRYIVADVRAAVTAALSDAFSFESRSFAQPATAAEVVSIIQSVPGVIASDLNRLFTVTVRKGAERIEGLPPVLCASPAQLRDGQILPAELLMINPAGITLTEMQP